MSEVLFTTLFEQLPDPIWILRKHRFVAANPAALAAIGYTDRPALIDLHPAEVSPGRQPDGESSFTKAERMMDLAEQRGLYRFDWIHQRRDGSRFPAEITLLAIEWQGGPALFCFWRDMSERERDRELHENMEETAGIGGWELDLNTQMVWWTKQVYRIHELPPGEPVPLNRGLIFYAPEARPILEEALRQAIRQGTPWDLELPFVTARGRPLWVRAVGQAGRQDGRIVRLFGSLQDVTARHAAETARAASQQRLQFVTDHAPVMIAWVDRACRYRFVNRHYAVFFATTPDALVGKLAREVLGETAFAKAQPFMNEALTGKPVAYELELADHPRGSKQMLVSYAPEFEGDQVIGFVAAVTDITERKRDEQLAVSRALVLELITKGAPLHRVLEAIVSNVETGNPAILCSILLLDATGRRLLIAAAPSLPEAFNQAINGLEIGPNAGSCGAAAYSGQRVIVEDIATHPNWTGLTKLAAEANLGACWSEPILSAAGQVLGTFALYHRTAHRPSVADTRLIEESANLAAIAIERVRVIESLRFSEERYRLLAENVRDVIWTMDADGHWTYISPAVQSLLGYSAAEAAALPIAAVLSSDGTAALTGALACLVNPAKGEAPGPDYRGEFELTRKDGSRVWVELSVTGLRKANGETQGVLGVIHDVSERKQSEAKIWWQANYDALTRLPNRRLFQDRLQQDLTRARRTGRQVALLYIDLDRFKEVNDVLGHAAGDELLIEVAQRIQHCIRKVDTVARLGGDEFTVIMADMAAIGREAIVAQLIIEALARRFELHGKSFGLSASVGIALCPVDGVEATDLMRHADQAMYHAKQVRNQYRYFTPELHTTAVVRQQLTSELREALSRNQFEVHYQPIVDLTSGSINKAEALVRWRHPIRGLLTAEAFIPAAESSGLINDLGDWIFREAAQWVLERQRRTGGPFRVSVNKSSVQFIVGHTEQSWPDWLDGMGLAGNAIVIEVNEGLLLSKRPEILGKLRRLRLAGMGLAIDDFGTGYSALAYLKQFDAEFLKIDISLIRDLVSDPEDRALCETLIMVAHKLGIQVIAEGVETPEQRDWLLAAGCDCAQGFLFGRPLPAGEIDW